MIKVPKKEGLLQTKTQKEGYRVEEAAMLHTHERDEVLTFLCLKKSHRGRANTLPSCTDAHLPFRQNMALHLFPDLSQQANLNFSFLLSLHFLTIIPPALLLSSRFSTPTHRSQHILRSPSPSLSFSPHIHAHALSGSKPTSALQETALWPPPLCFPSLSCYIPEYLSSHQWPPPHQPSPISITRERAQPWSKLLNRMSPTNLSVCVLHKMTQTYTTNVHARTYVTGKLFGHKIKRNGTCALWQQAKMKTKLRSHAASVLAL